MKTVQFCWLELVLALMLAALLLYYKWMSAYTYWKKRKVPYLEPKFPFGNVNDVFLLRSNFRDSWLDMYNQAGNVPYFGVYTIRTPVLVINDPVLIRQILVKDFSHFTDHGWFTSCDHEPLIRNLFVIDGEDWKRSRAKMSPAFSSGKLKLMFSIMNECAQQMRTSLLNSTERSGSVDVKDLTGRYTSDIILNCVFGVNANSSGDRNCVYYRTGERILTRSMKRLISNIILVQSPKLYSLLKLHFLDYEACEYFAKLMRDNIDYREKHNVTRNDFLNMMIRLKQNLSIDDDDDDENVSSSNSEKVTKARTKTDYQSEETPEGMPLDELLAHSLMFFFAGFETTSSMISFCLYELARRPDLQQKIQTELDEAVQRYGGLTYQTLNELPYMDKAIFETMRRYSTLPVINRVCTKTYRIPNTDTVLEKGCKIAIPAYGIHHDPKYYPDPFVFDPDRFTEENIKRRPSYVYLPFGEGPRICIGTRFGKITMKLSLATFFAEFNCQLNPATPVPLTIASGEVVTMTRDEILIDVVYRNQTKQGFN